MIEYQPGEFPPVSIHLDDIHKQIGAQHVLRGVTLEIFAGETIVLIGASGSGKSVILKHITGLMRPDRGRILIEGQNIAGLHESDLADIRRKIGVLFQNGALFDSMTVGQNVAFPLRERGEKDMAVLIKKVTEALSLVGLVEHINKMPNNLSGGMRKRVALARAMIARPQSILYDEPTAGLDPVSAGAIDALIQQMQENYGVTSVVITHDIKSAKNIADRIVFLREGAIYFCGSPKELEVCEDPIVQNFVAGVPTDQI